jgi:predicted ribosomally synthesized peptide with SipW-like signal peptide
MNRKILLSILMIAVTAAFVGMATYALFNSTVSSSNNQFVAGTMNLTVDGASTLAPLNFANLTPGWTQTKTYALHNSGNVVGRGQVFLNNFVDAGALADNVTLAVDQDGAPVYTGTLRDFSAASNDLDLMNGGDDSTVTVTYSIDPSVGNSIQNDTATFDMGFSLTSVPQN